MSKILKALNKAENLNQPKGSSRLENPEAGYSPEQISAGKTMNFWSTQQGLLVIMVVMVFMAVHVFSVNRMVMEAKKTQKATQQLLMQLSSHENALDRFNRMADGGPALMASAYAHTGQGPQSELALDDRDHEINQIVVDLNMMQRTLKDLKLTNDILLDRYMEDDSKEASTAEIVATFERFVKSKR